MALSFSNNILAQRSILSFNSVNDRNSNSIAKLSSGLRIKDAEDGPVDYAVREVYRAELSVMDQSIRNAQMGISTMQTAESGINDIHNLLVRIKELATQSSTGTYTNTQRLMINSEVSQLAAEIDRIANTTNISGINLLDGSLSSANNKRLNGSWFQNDTDLADTKNAGLKIHYGLQNRVEDYLFMKIGNMTTDGLLNGIGPDNQTTSEKLDVSSQAGAQKALEFLESAMIRQEESRANLGAMQNRLNFTIDSFEARSINLQQAESDISDLDIAEEMTEFTSAQMLSQAGVAMISQANIVPRAALSLLK